MPMFTHKSKWQNFYLLFHTNLAPEINMTSTYKIINQFMPYLESYFSLSSIFQIKKKIQFSVTDILLAWDFFSELAVHDYLVVI